MPVVFWASGNNGQRIPTDRIGKIFGSFCTTKEVGQGTGLGLSISFGIVKGHGGGIYVSGKSKPDK